VLKDGDISSAYKYLSLNENLSNTIQGKKLEKQWNEISTKANSFAAKGDAVSVKNILSEFFNIPSKFTAIAVIFSYAYINQLEKALKEKKSQEEIEKGIKNYYAMFGDSELIQNFFKLFKKYHSDTKLNLEKLPKGLFEMWSPKMAVETILK
jgi:putative IMPACT (imprinted ancient) family translation regulator